MSDRTCLCGAPASNRKGPPRCRPCRAERVRLAQLRFRDKGRGSPQRGLDEPTCIWCGVTMTPRPYEVLSPKRFCTSTCRDRFHTEQDRLRRLITRVCCRCGDAPTNRTGIPYCDACRNNAKREQARTRVLRPYGISLKDYDQLLTAQRGRCAICGTTDPGHGHKVFAIDHCHEGGYVRGLLCRNCNSAIGLLQDSPDVIEAAARYVRRTRQIPLFP